MAHHIYSPYLGSCYFPGLHDRHIQLEDLLDPLLAANPTTRGVCRMVMVY
jgi:hypothetical protein